jgi:alcohol dehydrogenase YqhD (iron-dependent ADH family)
MSVMTISEALHAALYEEMLRNPEVFTIGEEVVGNTGCLGDWTSHMIEQAISAIYDMAHGAGLAVVFPAWMKYTLTRNREQFAQFAVRVWNVEYDFENPEATAREGIHRLEYFYCCLVMPLTLRELQVPEDRLEEMAAKALIPWMSSGGAVSKLSQTDILAVLKLAV